MAIIKCKMCGGDIELSPDKTFGTCEFCGSTMTFPKVDDEQRAAAFNRGNHFRRIGEFDKALAVYERIVQEDDTDAEAHWCCALCRFGIEYVEDPNTYEWLPTCHRLSFDSFLEDVDYLSAVEHSDGVTRRQYQKDAARIAEVQRGILAASRNAEPFDVFICYKESNENGERTRDSALAQDIYYQLTEQGRRVFFARITLEDVAGSEYEPYIFAALNSAKVMVVVGTKSEHLNAVWVKNEWSRFLALMKKDRRKLLLPCYRDMDPYDMPEQLSVLQSYDMAKIGFIQDLTRGIAKVLDADRKPAQTVIVQENANVGNTGALLDRGMMALEDGDWQKADGFFEEVLNQNAKCAEAYVGKALAEAKCRSLEAFIQSRLAYSGSAKGMTADIPVDAEHMESAAKQYAVPGYLAADEVKGLYRFDLTYSPVEQIRKQQKADEEAFWKNHRQLSRARQFAAGNYKETFEGAYRSLMRAMDERIADARRQEKEDVAALRARYTAYLKEADEKAAQMSAGAQSGRERDYQIGCKRQEGAANIQHYNDAINYFRLVGDYKDSKQRIEQCREGIARINAEKEARAKEDNYQIACKRQMSAEGIPIYEDAIKMFQKLGDYKDSKQRIDQCREGIAQIKAEEAARIKKAERRRARKRILRTMAPVAVVAAIVILAAAAWSAVQAYRQRTLEEQYGSAVELLSEGNIPGAAVAFGKAGDHSDARARAFELWNEIAVRNTVAAGYSFTIGLKSDGTVVATGDNYYRQCNVSNWTDIVAVAAGNYHTVGLKSDGTVVAAGYNSNGQCNVSKWTDIVAVAAGEEHTIGLKSDGTVVAAGNNNQGQRSVSEWTDIVAVAAGSVHTIGLRSDGTVVAAGSDSFGQCNVSSWTDIVAVAAGNYHTIGLKSDGTVVAAGSSNSMKIDVSDWTDIVAVAAGGSDTAGLKSDGTVVTDARRTGVSDWTDIVAVAAGGFNFTIGLKSDGTVVAAGYNLDGQCDVSGWTGIKVPN